MEMFSKENRRGLICIALVIVFILTVHIYLEWDYRRDQALTRIDIASKPMMPMTSFDPNTVAFEELAAMGVDFEFSVWLVRWRSYGKVYRVVEDLALVKGMTDSLYRFLKPYVVIGEEYAPKVKTYTSDSYNSVQKSSIKSYNVRESIAEPFVLDTVSVEYMTRWGFSPRQAEVLLHYRDAIGGIRSEEQLRKCYVVDEPMADRLLQYVVFVPEANVLEPMIDKTTADSVQKPAPMTLLDLNSADSAMLVAVDGIGAKSAFEIIKYRELLGGYHSVEQLSELKSVTESNFEKILQQIYCDSCKISKIDINFAGPKELERHPYVSARALRRIIKQRQLKGGWSRIEEMIEDDILSEEEAERLAPYLRFGPRATE